jgi:tRNA(Ile)-lysidine synthase
VALLRALAERSGELGLVLHAAHLHHGLRGDEADADLAFARALAAELGLPFHETRVDVPAEARANAESGKAAESIEEAARRLRYGWFRQLLASGEVDAVATAHTRDDQAETVLAKFLRGAWTEGLSGIHSVVEFPEGRILRPLLGATRAEVEAFLHALGQSWREDSSNRHLTFTRNRIRHELLPLLETWNPQLREHLAQMAVLARDEEAWWQDETARLAPQLILPGRPVRGGGRASSEDLALDLVRLAALAPPLQRRLLRYAAGKLGATPDFAATETLRNLANDGRAGQKCELEGMHAERTHRELRLSLAPVAAAAEGAPEAVPEYLAPIPGEIEAPAFGLRLRIELSAPAAPHQFSVSGHDSSRAASAAKSTRALAPAAECAEDSAATPMPRAGSAGQSALLRNWKPGDRVLLRYSSGPRKVKEVLERLKVTGTARALWPVLELDGRIVWMRGAELEPEPGIEIAASPLDAGAAEPAPAATFRQD